MLQNLVNEHTYVSHTAVPVCYVHSSSGLESTPEVTKSDTFMSCSSQTISASEVEKENATQHNIDMEIPKSDSLTASSSETLSALEVEKENVTQHSDIMEIPKSDTLTACSSETLSAPEVEKENATQFNVNIVEISKSTSSSSETLSASEVEKENFSKPNTSKILKKTPKTSKIGKENTSSSPRSLPASDVDGTILMTTSRNYSMKRPLQETGGENIDDNVENPEECKPKSKKRRSFMPRNFGDIQYEDLDDPNKRKVCWNIIQNTFQKERQKVKNLQMKTRRLKDRIYSLRSLTNHLQRISDLAESTLNSTMSPALTLHFYSRKAYEYVRRKFNNVLPHIRTLSKWIATIDASPGFMEEAKNALAIKAKEAEIKHYKLICNLVIDEMSIYKKIEWDGKKTYGYIDLGTNVEGDDLEEATQALVFMVVCLNGHWKIPIAYFLINSLTGREKTNLVLNCLEFVNDTKIVITSITFD